MDPRRLQTILVQREAAPQTPETAQALLAMLGPGQAFANAQGNKSLRVTARIAFDSGQRMTTEVVIFLLDNGTDPYRILTWRDDMDDTPASARRPMTGYADLSAFFSRWIDAAAGAIVAAISSFATRKTVQVIEEDTGTFVIQSDRDAPSGLPFERVQILDGKLAGAHPDSIVAMLNGSRAELKLRPARVLFRPLELPQRATEFLGGVVRAQIDRLTPWTANDAVFGWSEPAEAGADRIAVTVAATARALVQPVVDALSAAGAEARRRHRNAAAAARRSRCSTIRRPERSILPACAARWSPC